MRLQDALDIAAEPQIRLGDHAMCEFRRAALDKTPRSRHVDEALELERRTRQADVSYPDMK
jgi:hypothetical protein